ncbi:MAG: hypothetical protein R6V27_10050 [Balneolaceae bacterium]
MTLFSTVILYRRLNSYSHPEYTGYTVLLMLAATLGMLVIDNPILERAIDLMLLGVILLVLIFILISIRMLQPGYARHPLFYTFLPILIFPFYAYFVDSDILSSITQATLQGTSLLVFSGLVFQYWKTIERGYLLFVSIIFYLAAFLLYWFLDIRQELIHPVIHLLTGTGMILTCFKFPEILIQHKR